MLTGKVIVISGGVGAIGANFAHATLKNNGICVLTDINVDKLDQLERELGKIYNNNNICSIHMDITNKDSINECISAVNKRFGRIDVLVNSAYPRTQSWGKDDFLHVRYEDMCTNFNMHMGGYLLTSQQFCKYFLEQGHGNVISMSSIHGVYAPKFETYNNTHMDSPIEYCVMKAGIIHMSRYIAKFFAQAKFKGKAHIRANAIAPGGILGDQPECFLKSYESFCSSKGMLDAADLDGTFVFLASDLSKYINGQTIIVDDGWGL